MTKSKEREMYRSKIFWPAGVALALALAFGTTSASADTASYSLTSGNSPNGLSGFPGPYATVTVSLIDPTHAQFTYDSATSGGYTYLLAGQGAVAANINASSFTVSGISSTNSFAGFTPGPVTQAAAGNEDGFGSFNLTMDSFDGYQHSNTEVTFTVQNNSGVWVSAANVLAANDSGENLAIHGFAVLNPVSIDGSPAATGYASGAQFTTTAVPEPSSMAIAGLGALGFVGYSLRRRLKK